MRGNKNNVSPSPLKGDGEGSAGVILFNVFVLVCKRVFIRELFIIFCDQAIVDF